MGRGAGCPAMEILLCGSVGYNYREPDRPGTQLCASGPASPSPASPNYADAQTPALLPDPCHPGLFPPLLYLILSSIPVQLTGWVDIHVGKTETHRDRANQGNPDAGDGASSGPNPCFILNPTSISWRVWDILRVALASFPGNTPREEPWGMIGDETVRSCC